jgi:hypothetical protein
VATKKAAATPPKRIYRFELVVEYDLGEASVADIVGDVQDIIEFLNKESPGIAVRAVLVADSELDFLSSSK